MGNHYYIAGLLCWSSKMFHSLSRSTACQHVAISVDLSCLHYLLAFGVARASNVLQPATCKCADVCHHTQTTASPTPSTPTTRDKCPKYQHSTRPDRYRHRCAGQQGEGTDWETFHRDGVPERLCLSIYGYLRTANMFSAGLHHKLKALLAERDVMLLPCKYPEGLQMHFPKETCL